MPSEVRSLLASELELDESDVYVTKGLLDQGSLWQLADLDRPDLKDEPPRAWTQPRLREVQRGSADLFQVLEAFAAIVAIVVDDEVL